MSNEARSRDGMGAHLPPAADSFRLTMLSSAFMACVALYFVLPGNALPKIGWHYFGGGSEFQKIHPATFLLVAVFSMLVVLDRVFQRRCIVQLKTDHAFVAFGFAALAASLFAIVVRGASIANLLETFALALMVRLAIVAAPRRSMAQFRIFVDLMFIVGAATVFWEFAFKRSIIFENPIFYDQATEQFIVTEFRAAGIFGHPLSAAGFFSLYSILILVSTPMRLTIGCATRLALAGLSFVAILPTGGRSALLVGGLVMAAFIGQSVLRSLARGTFSKAGLVWFVTLMAGLLLALPVMDHFDVFDVMLARFARDDGSTLSREYAFQILFNTRLQDLWFGLDQSEVMNLQRQYGLVAIENAWINFAMVCGLVITIPLLVTYLLFLFRSNPRYCTSGIYYTALFQFILSNATNDLWAKNTAFATGLAIVFSFLRKDMVAQPQNAGGYHKSSQQIWPMSVSHGPAPMPTAGARP